MGSQATRAYVVESGDYYLCPLSKVQLSHSDRLKAIASVKKEAYQQVSKEVIQADGTDVIPHFINQIKQGNQITVFGESKVLDFTYVDDCVAGVSTGLERLVRGEIKNHTINLAYGQGNSLVNMAKYIGEALGVEPNMKVEPARVGEVTHYVANIGKARALLNYHPKTPLREGIHKTVAWAIDWWETHGYPQKTPLL